VPTAQRHRTVTALRNGVAVHGQALMAADGQFGMGAEMHQRINPNLHTTRSGVVVRRHVAAAIWAVALTRVVFGWVMS
jgi:hypothetical protein